MTNDTRIAAFLSASAVCLGLVAPSAFAAPFKDASEAKDKQAQTQQTRQKANTTKNK
jgi:hypothetical protein